MAAFQNAAIFSKRCISFQSAICINLHPAVTTYVDTSFLGHSYFTENRSVLSDMFNLIRNGERADMRFGLRPVDAQTGRYWEFK